MGLIALFGTIHKFHCTISANFYLYLQHFQQKNFNFSKINRSQTDTMLELDFVSIYDLFSLLLNFFWKCAKIYIYVEDVKKKKMKF